MTARITTAAAGLVLCAALASAARGAEAPVRAASRVTAVAVMPDRAVVTRRFTAEFPAGRSVVEIDGLLPGLDERTLRATPDAWEVDARVVDVSSEVYERPAPGHERLAALEEEKRALELRVRAVEDEIVALNERGRVLGELRKLTIRAMRLGSPKVAGPDAWRKAVDFISVAAREATRRIREAEARRFAINESVREVDARIAIIRGAGGTLVRRARVAVECGAAGSRAFELSYLVRGGVKWGPRYEARLDGSAGRIELASLAAVRQETGEDWTAARLTFSTRRPAKGLAPPPVAPVFLEAADRTTRISSVASVEVEEDESLADIEEEAPAGGLAAAPAGRSRPGVGEAPKAAPKSADLIAEVRASGEAAEFTAREPVTVRTDGRAVSVALGRWEAGCTWRLEAAPKLLGSVYVRAEFPNATGSALLSGPADAYLDGRYVGRMEMPLTAAGAEVAMSFGAAEGLAVARTAEPLTSERARGGGRRYLYAFHIELANSGPAPAEVTVLENVPVSTVEAIAVAVSPETTPADELPGGRLRWRVELEPGERKTLRLAYSVEIGRHYRY